MSHLLNGIFKISSSYKRRNKEKEEREKEKQEIKQKTKAKWIENYDQFLFHPKDIPYQNWVQIPEVFTEFRKKPNN